MFNIVIYLLFILQHKIDSSEVQCQNILSGEEHDLKAVICPTDENTAQRGISTATSEHHGNETATSEHHGNETATSEHHGNETATSEHNGNETATSEHNGNETATRTPVESSFDWQEETDDKLCNCVDQNKESDRNGAVSCMSRLERPTACKNTRDTSWKLYHQPMLKDNADRSPTNQASRSDQSGNQSTAFISLYGDKTVSDSDSQKRHGCSYPLSHGAMENSGASWLDLTTCSSNVEAQNDLDHPYSINLREGLKQNAANRRNICTGDDMRESGESVESVEDNLAQSE